ncbi:MAG TPA: single-stranded DNA-binding protein [Candidatus Dormibacteraeota bacterium]|nr:single-stranded DNA-binding protein [Candidatus Dormibacteraeota bacterium]
MNRVLLVGYLASDPEVRASQTGLYVAKMRVATNTYAGKAEDGTRKETTQFHSLVAFGKLAEFSGNHLHKGSLVAVEGKLQTSSWEDAATGQKRSRTEVAVDAIDFVGPKPREEAAA